MSMPNLFDIFLQPFTYDFMLRGLLASIIVGVVCAVVGVYVVLRGMAFFGDALAHAVLPGVALGYLLGGGGRNTLFWWALGAAV
jgi:manganese/iron transport system permease protein